MQTWSYPALFEHHGADGYVVRFPDFPEAVTGGDTLEESRALAADALDLVVRDYLTRGAPVPEPRRAHSGEEPVPLDPLTAARALLARTMAREQLTDMAVAARIGRSEAQVRRMLDGRGGVRIEGVLEALAALGVRPMLAAE